MRIDLAAMVRRAGKVRRSEAVIRPIKPAPTLATDLFHSAHSPMLALWTEALPLIVAEYERSLAAMTQDSPADIGSLLTRVDDRFDTLALSIKVRLRQWAMRAEAGHRRKWIANVFAAINIDLSTMLGPEDARTSLEATIERNVSLVKSVSDEIRSRISDAVFRGLAQRKPSRELAKELSEATGMGRARSLRIASDQNSKLAATLNEERAMQVGMEFYEWVHSGKSHPRQEHKARDGNRYRYGEPAGDMPGQLPFCGCTARAVLSLDGDF